jgi:Skp family chaperone for outer membrane proteins
MKKILIAFAALSLGLAACNSIEKAVNNLAVEPVKVDSLATTGRVAYFYVDRVVAEYTFAQTKQAEFQKKYDAATKKLSATETAINKDYQKLQQQVVELNEKAQKVLITQADYQKEMERLAGEEQKIQTRIASFQAEMQKVQNELAEEEIVVTNQIMDNVSKYVQQLNAEYSYDVIIASTVGSPVFHANPLLDLTDTIVKGLNAAK